MSDKLDRLDNLLKRLDEWMPKSLTDKDWTSAVAFRWRRKDTLLGKLGYLQPVRHISGITFKDLHHIERQTDLIFKNTKHFIEGKPANNGFINGRQRNW